MLLNNIGDLSRPVTTLIEKVSSAVGIIYEPTHLIRTARAEVAAEKIRALGRLEITELQQRGLERLIHQEGRKQANIEQITAQAAGLLPKDAEVEGLDEDWIAHFFKQCEIISDKQMQSLWAKLLSGEATRPGTFSKRTIDLVSSLDKKDAALFTTLCQFVWFLYSKPIALIYGIKKEILSKYKITFYELNHLASIGLISLEPLRGYQRSELGKNIVLRYYDREALIEFPADENNMISAGHVLLTSVGEELAPICSSSPNYEYYDFVIQRLLASGRILSSICR